MLEDRAALELVVKRAYEAGRRALRSGAVAKAPVTAGDAELAFYMQSVSKLFSRECRHGNRLETKSASIATA